MSLYDDPGGPGGYASRNMGTMTRRSPDGDVGWDSYPGGRRGGSRQSGYDRGNRGGGRPRRPKTGLMGTHPVMTTFAVITTIVLVTATLGAYIVYRKTVGSINHENVTSAMLGPRPPKLNGAMNILLIGSDSRAGTHGQYGKGIYGSRSDTSMLLHISPTHQRVIVVSFPRDSMVPVYHCLPDGHGHLGQQAVPGQLEQLNATFSAGGAPCLWKTLEQTTHIHIDHFIEVNFLSFKKIVNDIGGVPVCLPYPIHDWRSKLYLSAGRHVIRGPQALAFVRVRHIGLGSDLQRIQRQQLFLASAAQRFKHSGVITSPTGLINLVHDIATSLTTDVTNPTTLLAIANSLKGLNTKALRFISVPVIPYPPNPLAWVEWAQPQANDLFTAIAHDNHVPKTAKSHITKASPPPTVSPSKVQLEVFNGSGTPGLASTTASELTSRGFIVTSTGDAPNFSYTSSVIEYSAASEIPEVNTLKEQITGVQVKKVTSLPASNIALILGSSFTNLSGHSSSSASSGGHTGNKLSASHLQGYGGINGNTNICKDTSAFAGVGGVP